MAGRGFYINFKVPELQEELAKMNAYDGAAADRVENVISDSTKSIGQGTRRRMRVRSGGTKKSIRSNFDRRKLTGTVRVRKPHAHILEFGAKAAVVRPEKKKALVIDEFGLRNYATEAHIPRRAAYPSLGPSFEDEKPNLIRGVKKAVRP